MVISAHTQTKETLRMLALEQGFQQAGFAEAHPPPGAEALPRWLEAGYAGPLTYMERDPERRIDPKRYWPPAQTLLVVSMTYAPHTPEPEVGPLEGRIARYARTLDYHDVMKERLFQLRDAARRLHPGLNTVAVVDSSAVLERAHAVAAGLGWAAKNSMLLSRNLGSYTLLGALLLDMALEPDQPVTPHCGSCRRCLDACPTGALVQPGMVDARLCISTLTIELKGSIPPALRPQLAGWAFGCDLCQEVCPWTRRAGTLSPRETLPRSPLTAEPELAVVSLEQLALDTPEQFAQRWKKRPQKRSKRTGLARNAVTLLGSSPDREGAVHILEQSLGDPAPMVRGHTAWSLGRQGGPRAKAALEQSLTRETDPDTRAEILCALESLGCGAPAQPNLDTALLSDPPLHHAHS